MEKDSKNLLNCIHCDKIYETRRRLTEHIKRTHKKNSAGETILESKFMCHTCGKLFCRKDGLYGHIKKLHHSSEEFKCEYCTFKTKFKFNLKSHVNRQHVNNEKVTKTFACSYCKTGFVNETSLKRHLGKVHGIQWHLGKKKIHRKCPLCSFTTDSLTTKIINTHFSKVHEIALRMEKHDFATMDDFYRWKDDLQKNTNNFFAKQSQRKNLAYYRCHRRGQFKRKGTNRQLKRGGSWKINGYCPSGINVKFSECGSVSVTYVATHVGHTNNSNKLKVSKRNRPVPQQYPTQLDEETPVIIEEQLEPIIEISETGSVSYVATHVGHTNKLKVSKRTRTVPQQDPIQLDEETPVIIEELQQPIIEISETGSVSYVATHVGHTNKLKVSKRTRTISQQDPTQLDEETPLTIEEQQQPILKETIVSVINNDSNIINSNKLEEYLDLLLKKANTLQKKQFAAKRIKELLVFLDAMDATGELSAKETPKVARACSGKFTPNGDLPQQPRQN